MALVSLADMGIGGWVLLILLGASVLALLIGLVFLIDYVLRPHGEHVARAGLDIASPVPSPTGSMQLDQDTEAWQARQWEHEFRAHHSAEEVFAAADQAGGWVSGSMTNGSGGSGDPWAMGLPPDGHGPDDYSPLSPWPVPTQDPGPSHLGDRRCEPLSAGRPGPEVAHDEYAGPVPGVSPAPAEWAGPVPWQDELSKMDADTLRWLADYTDRWRQAAAEFTRKLAA